MISIDIADDVDEDGWSQAAVDSDEEGSSLLDNKKDKLKGLINNTYNQL